MRSGIPCTHCPGEELDRVHFEDGMNLLICYHCKGVTKVKVMTEATPLGEGLGNQEKKMSNVPPSALEAERMVLGALLFEPELYDNVIGASLHAADFYVPAHRKVFEVIQELHEAGEPVDVLSVVDILLQDGQLDSVGGAAGVAQLESTITTAVNVVELAELVREKAQLRALIEAANEVIASAARGDRRVIEIIDEAERKILALSEEWRKKQN